MIICCYTGMCIGNASGNDFFIDLKPDNFKVCDNGASIYVEVAEQLSEQRYIVFVSIDKEVREYLAKKGYAHACVFPDISLEHIGFEDLAMDYEFLCRKLRLDKDFDIEPGKQRMINHAEHYHEIWEDLIKEPEDCKGIIESSDINRHLGGFSFDLGDFVIKHLYKKD